MNLRTLSSYVIILACLFYMNKDEKQKEDPKEKPQKIAERKKRIRKRKHKVSLRKDYRHKRQKIGEPGVVMLKYAQVEFKTCKSMLKARENLLKSKKSSEDPKYQKFNIYSI